jgi:hypothetical protein
MTNPGLVVGVLDTSGRTGDPELEQKLRDFTLSCCRFDYHGPILESSSVDDLLAEASQGGARYCLVQSWGYAMVRYGDRERAIHTNLIKALAEWLPGEDFLVAGRLTEGGGRWPGLDDLVFVVDLETYRNLGRPRFTPAAGVDAPPPLPGWGLVAASLENGKPVLGFDETLRHCGYDLRPRNAAEIEAIHRLGGTGIFGYDGSTDGIPLSEDWKGFLDHIHLQAKHAKRGVFLGNFESYEDVEKPRRDFQGPVSSLYAVAAGFKANRILHTHGFDRQTRMVFFDYSPRALDLRKILVEEWDGTDFPGFVERISGRVPDAFYQLWGNLWATRPGSLDMEMVRGIWEKELQIWGGEAAFQEHWVRYREIPHQFVDCDLFAASRGLLESMETGPREVLWWSNAFHSVNCVWFYPREERHRIYRKWLADAAAVNPELLLYGTDVDNLNLGGIRIRNLDYTINAK